MAEAERVPDRPSEQSPFRRFEELTKRLLSVSKRTVDEKDEQRKAAKKPRRSS
jgi:hypothetical protein